MILSQNVGGDSLARKHFSAYLFSLSNPLLMLWAERFTTARGVGLTSQTFTSIGRLISIPDFHVIRMAIRLTLKLEKGQGLVNLSSAYSGSQTDRLNRWLSIQKALQGPFRRQAGRADQFDRYPITAIGMVSRA